MKWKNRLFMHNVNVIPNANEESLSLDRLPFQTHEGEKLMKET